MYGREKSPEFIEQMYKDKHGSNNPMWGKTHSIPGRAERARVLDPGAGIDRAGGQRKH